MFQGSRESKLSPLKALTHDLSKYRPSEAIPYAQYWHGEKTPETRKAFREAAQKHYKRNKHHFEAPPSEVPRQIELEHIVDM